jgi:ketosteroid isomerase-like protein
MTQSVSRTGISSDASWIRTVPLTDIRSSLFKLEVIRIPILPPIVLLILTLASSCTFDQKGEMTVSKLSEEIITIERSALDRWITFDPEGYLDLYTLDVTYFDPSQESRIDGLEAMRRYYGPIKDLKGTIREPRYEMISPKVQAHGEIAILTFKLINYGKRADKPETVLARWNSTEVYTQINGQWKIIHSHWSYIKPQIQQPGL